MKNKIENFADYLGYESGLCPYDFDNDYEGPECTVENSCIECWKLYLQYFCSEVTKNHGDA